MRRSFRAVVARTGLGPGWTPRELRHSFVSLLSSSGMAIEDISHLIGHASTNVTEKVYRKELRPVLTKGAHAALCRAAALEARGPLVVPVVAPVWLTLKAPR